MDEQALAKVMETGDTRAYEQQFRGLPRHEQRRLLVNFIERGRSDEEIGRLIGLSQWQVRNLRYRLGIKKDRGGNVYLENPERHENRPATASLPGAAAAQSPFSLVIRGTFQGEQLTSRLDGLRALFDAAGPGRRFRVHIELLEETTGGDDGF